MQGYEKDKATLASSKARLKVQDDDIAALKWELEVLQQRCVMMIS